MHPVEIFNSTNLFGQREQLNDFSFNFSEHISSMKSTLFNFLTNQYVVVSFVIFILILFEYITRRLPLRKLTVFKFISILSIVSVSLASLMEIFLIRYGVRCLADLIHTKASQSIIVWALSIAGLILFAIDRSKTKLTVYIATIIGKGVIFGMKAYILSLPIALKSIFLYTDFFYPCIFYILISEIALIFVKPYLLEMVSEEIRNYNLIGDNDDQDY